MDRDIIPEENLIDFYLDSDRNIWGKFFGVGYHSLKKVNHQGKVEKTWQNFPLSLPRKQYAQKGSGIIRFAAYIFLLLMVMNLTFLFLKLTIKLLFMPVRKIMN